MFIGHYAVALGAKRAAPDVSLGTLFLASQLVDLLWPLFLLLGFEHVRIDPGNTVMTPLDFYDYPFTHSLPGALAWSLLTGLVYYGFRGKVRNALVVAGTVFSHWILDLLTHRPDLQLGFGNTVYVGLGLWNSLWGTLLLELSLFLAGLVLYLRCTRARDRYGSYGLWSLLAVLLLVYAGNLFGPPPPSEAAIAIAGNAAWLFVFWAYVVGRHREPLSQIIRTPHKMEESG
jgi:membrane-bound metal-dependent hydrolase YbcI (DUF457 family)